MKFTDTFVPSVLTPGAACTLVAHFVVDEAKAAGDFVIGKLLRPSKQFPHCWIAQCGQRRVVVCEDYLLGEV